MNIQNWNESSNFDLIISIEKKLYSLFAILKDLLRFIGSTLTYMVLYGQQFRTKAETIETNDKVYLLSFKLFLLLWLFLFLNFLTVIIIIKMLTYLQVIWIDLLQLFWTIIEKSFKLILWYFILCIKLTYFR